MTMYPWELEEKWNMENNINNISFINYMRICVIARNYSPQRISRSIIFRNACIRGHLPANMICKFKGRAYDSRADLLEHLFN